VNATWPSHGITESEAKAKCRSIILDKDVIGNSCFAKNIRGGTSADDIVQACVSDVQVLLVSFHISFLPVLFQAVYPYETSYAKVEGGLQICNHSTMLTITHSAGWKPRKVVMKLKFELFLANFDIRRMF